MAHSAKIGKMGLKNQLTKTPYLVLFIVLISIGVGTASALTITLGADLIEFLGILDMNLNRIINVGTPTLASDAATKNYVDNNNFQFIKTVERLGTEVLVPAGNDGIATVDCMVGEVATGGGWFESTELGDPIIFVSEPIITNGIPTGWSVEFGAEGGTEGLQAIVICATLQNTPP